MLIGFKSSNIDNIKLKENVSTIAFKEKVDKVLSDKRITKEEFSDLAKDVKGGEKSLYKILGKLNPEVDFKKLMSKTGYVQLSSNTQKDNLVNLLDKMSGANIKIEHVTFDKAKEKPMVVAPKVEEVAKKEVKIEHNPMGKLEIPEGSKAVVVKNPGIRASITKDLKFDDVLIPSKEDKDKKVPLTFKKGETISARESDIPGKSLIQKLKKTDEGYETVGEPVLVDSKLLKSGDQSFKTSDKPLFKDIPSTKDIKQGAIGDCFLIASLNAMLNKGGPEEIYKMIKDNNDGTVTVKMFDVKNEPNPEDPKKMIKTFTPKYITFDKSTLDTSVTIDKFISPTKMAGAIIGEHARGALWVQMLEKAYAINQGSYSKLNEGGHMNNPFEAFLGQEAIQDSTVDIPKTTAKEVSNLFESVIPKYDISEANLTKFQSSLKGKFTDEEIKTMSAFVKSQGNFGEPEFENVKLGALKSIGIEVGEKYSQEDINSKGFSVFNAIRKGLSNPDYEKLQTFRRSPTPQPLLQDASDISNGKKNIKGKSQDYHRQISYEEIEKVFNSKDLKISDESRSKILAKAKEIYPPEKNVGNYIKAQNEIFSKIQEKLKNNEYIGAGTSSYIGKSDSKGFSGGESVVDGLVGGHAFTVKDTVTMHGTKFIKVENPWGETGRAYDMVDGKMVAKKVNEGDSWIELSDFTKHFNDLYFTKQPD
ncbi:MAG: C2 family cysteine protease [Candidatus Sericytochromatia bacterium]